MISPLGWRSRTAEVSAGAAQRASDGSTPGRVRPRGNAFWEFDPNTGNLISPYLTDNWVKNTTNFVGPSLAAHARSLYPSSSYDSVLWAFITMTTDGSRGCPTREMATTVASHVPVWRYLYTRRDETDPSFAQLRASHEFEEQFLWGGDVLGSGYVLSPAEQLLSNRMTDYWTNFAKTGNPNGAGLPTWPRYNAASEPTLTLDDQVGAITNYHDEQCAFFDTVPAIFPCHGRREWALRTSRQDS